MNVRVISQEVDGAELRREQTRNALWTRCDGKQDDEQIRDGLDRLGKTVIFTSSDEYERIFGGAKDGGR